MRAIAIVLCFLFGISGCSKQNESLNRVLLLRNKLQSSNGCSFRAVISADYGKEVYSFAMDCQTDKEGNLTFRVIEPSSIAGITGSVKNNDPAIFFDDKILGFQAIADDQISPVMAPWIFIKTLRSGYIKGCAKTDDGIQISIDDSYEADSLFLNIWTGQNDLPKSCEIFWQNRRVLTLSVEDFQIL